MLQSMEKKIMFEEIVFFLSLLAVDTMLQVSEFTSISIE